MEEFRLQTLLDLQFLCVCKHLGGKSLTHKMGHKKNNKQKHLAKMQGSKDARITEFKTLNQVVYESCYHTDLCSQPSSELFHILFKSPVVRTRPATARALSPQQCNAVTLVGKLFFYQRSKMC